jgi:hypothetical protein
LKKRWECHDQTAEENRMSDRGTEKLREEVNPVFNTAKACLQVMA